MSGIYVRSIPVPENIRKSEAVGSTGFLVITVIVILLAIVIGTGLFVVAVTFIPLFFDVSSQAILFGIVCFELLIFLVAVISVLTDSARDRKSGLLDWVEIWDVDATEAIGDGATVLLGCGDKTLSISGEWWANDFVEKWEEWRVFNRVAPDTFFPASRFSLWFYPKGTGRLRSVESADSPPLKINFVADLSTRLSVAGLPFFGDATIIPMKLSDILSENSSKE